MLKPVGERVLIEQLVEETKSGIILQDEDVRRVPKGKVIACEATSWKINDNWWLAPSVGSIVHFNAMAGEELKEGDKKYLIIKLSDVLAVEA